MDIAPAGEVKDNSGHFHLLIDTDELPAAGQPIPKTNIVCTSARGRRIPIDPRAGRTLPAIGIG